MFDLAVIGGGPAGYAAAIRGAQLGASVCLAEKHKLGGTCLNVGCIPTKALYKSAKMLRDFRNADEFGLSAGPVRCDVGKIMSRKARVVTQLVSGVGHLIAKNAITLFKEEAAFADSSTLRLAGGGTVKARRFILASGSANAVVPIPGIDGKGVLDSTALLDVQELPKSLAVIGGGVIGCEFASIVASFGVDVTLVEMLPDILAAMDKDCVKVVRDQMTKDGIRILTSARVLRVADGAAGSKTVEVESNGARETLTVDKILLAAGRKPYTRGLGLEKIGVAMDGPAVKVDGSLRTNVPGIFAAGDVKGGLMLAHSAYEEAFAAVENALTGGSRQVDSRKIPKVVFTFPEIASVGLTEQEAAKAGLDVHTGSFAFRNSGMAMIHGETKGFVKVVADRKYGEILGMHICGPDAAELIAEAALAVSLESGLQDVEAAVHSHPSLSEAVKEAVLAAQGRALHA